MNSTTLSYDFSYSGSMTLGASSGGGSVSFSGSVTWDGASLDGSGNGSGGGGGPGQTVGLSGSNSYSDKTPLGMDYVTVVGTGTATLAFASGVSVSPPSGATVNDFQLTSGTMTLTYHYTAVPEPGSDALLAGLVALGAVAWHRRKRPRVTQPAWFG